MYLRTCVSPLGKFIFGIHKPAFNVDNFCENDFIAPLGYFKDGSFHENDQRLLYSFLPKLPESPGAFSETQLRWINGHFPEDFAAACRAAYRNLN